MPTFHLTGPGGERTVTARDEREARHLAMVRRYGDISDTVTPRKRLPNGQLEPYKGLGLTITGTTP